MPDLSNLKMQSHRQRWPRNSGTLYGKVLGAVPGSDSEVSLRFTSVSPEIETLLRGGAHREAGASPPRRPAAKAASAARAAE